MAVGPRHNCDLGRLLLLYKNTLSCVYFIYYFSFFTVECAVTCMPVFLVTITAFVILRNVVLLFYATLSNVQYVIKNSVVTLSTFKLLFHHIIIIIIIINNSICLRHIFCVTLHALTDITCTSVYQPFSQYYPRVCYMSDPEKNGHT